MRTLFLVFLLGAACAASRTESRVVPPPSAAPPAPARLYIQPRPIVVRHATVLPASGPAIADGAVSFAGGKIIAVGANALVATPPGAEEIDATGMYVTPGLIDAHSHLGVYASPQTFATSDGNEATAPVTAEVSAKDSFWPQDPGLRRAAAGGVTAMLVLPGSANLIGGRGFPVKLHFGRTADEVRFPGAKDALKMACGENPKRVYGRDRHQAPATRMGDAAGYRQAFAQAQDYEARWEEWRKKKERDPKTAGAPPVRDLKLETLAAVLRGEILVQNHCYRADEMQVMIDIAREFGFRIRAFHHAIESYKLRDVLAEREVATATWADWWGFKMEAWDGIPENAALVTRAGARAVIHSDSPDGIQRLNQEAAKALFAARTSGIEVSDEEAVRWITTNPAWVMGVEDRTGSLEPGKMADLVLWDRHPFSVYARAQRTWADGVVTYDARAGAGEVSDFELGQGAASSLTARPAPAPQLGLAAPAPQAGHAKDPLPVSPAECTAIEGATLLSEGQRLDSASVVMRGGRIASVGIDSAASAGCRVVDGRGKVLAPGFIEPLSQLGLVEILLEESANDGAPRGKPAEGSAVHAGLRAADSLNPASVLFPIARLGGVTAAVAAPAGGLISGQSALAGTDGGLLRPVLAMHADLGQGGRSAISSTHGAAVELLREVLDDAREYGRRRRDFEQNRMRKLAASRLDLEALQPVLGGKLPLVLHAERAVDIRAAMALAREFSLRLVVAGGAEAWQVASELAAARVPVILRPTQDLPSDFDRLHSRADNAALLAASGVKILFTNDGEPHRVRTLPQEAGNAVAWGLPHAEALKAITANVADAFGLDAGRIRAGARADVVLWSSDPLELSSRPIAMWIGGRQVGFENRQKALFEKYRRLP